MAFFNSAVGVLQTLVVALGAGLGIWAANVKHFFTLLGKKIFTRYGNQFFTSSGKEFFTSYGKKIFTSPAR